MQKKVDAPQEITQEDIKKGLMSWVKNYDSYFQRYPSHKDFFDNVIAKDEILFKIWIDTYLPSAEEFYSTKVRDDAPRYLFEKWRESEKKTSFLTF